MHTEQIISHVLLNVYLLLQTILDNLSEKLHQMYLPLRHDPLFRRPWFMQQFAVSFLAFFCFCCSWLQPFVRTSGWALVAHEIKRGWDLVQKGRRPILGFRGCEETYGMKRAPFTSRQAAMKPGHHGTETWAGGRDKILDCFNISAAVEFVFYFIVIFFLDKVL